MSFNFKDDPEWRNEVFLPKLVLANGEPFLAHHVTLTDNQIMMAQRIGVTQKEYIKALLREGLIQEAILGDDEDDEEADYRDG